MSQYLQTVALEGVKCFARHGWYPEEQLTGGWFIVNISASFVPGQDPENIEGTINYEQLNEIILSEMKDTRKLLETVAKSMLDKILENNPFIKIAEVTIRKKNPVMGGEVGNSLVSLKYTAENGI